MKVAICFSGSIRDFVTCLPSLQRYVLNNINPDIFLHLWNMNDVSSLGSEVHFKWKNDSCNQNYVLEKLKPVSYVIDQYSDEWEKKIIMESGVDISKFKDDKLKNYGINACGMYYKIKECFQLVEDYSSKNNIYYDIVIRARLDFIWDDNIKITDFEGANDQTIFLIKDRYATHSKLQTNDKFFAGNFTVMKKMCNIFKNIEKYQNMGFMVEGQTLNELHIKQLNFKVKWIGHQYTYFKCMPRHIIKNNGKCIIIDNDLEYDIYWYELAYQLLYQGYQIIYQNDIDILNINILKNFPNFKIENKNFGKLLCYLSRSVNENIECPQIILNGQKNNKSNITYINFENIENIVLVDFIISIIITSKYGGDYFFNNKKIINPYLGENVIYRYLDHGYYQSVIMNFNPKTQKYLLTVGNDNRQDYRETFKIIDLVKYFDPKNSNIIPSNY